MGEGETGLLETPRQIALDLALLAAKLLFENGQTTERLVEATERLAAALGCRATLFLHWGDLTVRIADANGACADVVAAMPAGVDMGKVTAALHLIDQLCAGRIGPAAAKAGLQAIERQPPVSLLRFAAMAAAGAMALGVIFGAAHLISLLLIGLSAGAGAWLRRALAKMSRNPFVQPFCAALLAGAGGAAAVHLQLSSSLLLIAVCPCMVLVPGPHLLNGTLDLARARIGLGAARIGYAGLVILMICIGLLAGLGLGGVTLPVSGTSDPVPLGYDVIAAGVAVAAYGTFFSMPWRMLPIPMLIGMLAHASRWLAMTVWGVGAGAGALVACLLVGVIVTPVADRLRLPFAGFAFASVVSLIPGVFLFRLAGGMVELVAGRADLLPSVVADGATALMIMLAMAFGLIVPKMLIEYFWPDLLRQTKG